MWWWLMTSLVCRYILYVNCRHIDRSDECIIVLYNILKIGNTISYTKLMQQNIELMQNTREIVIVCAMDAVFFVDQQCVHFILVWNVLKHTREFVWEKKIYIYAVNQVCLREEIKSKYKKKIANRSGIFVFCSERCYCITLYTYTVHQMLLTNWCKVLLLQTICCKLLELWQHYYS